MSRRVECRVIDIGNDRMGRAAKKVINESGNRIRLYTIFYTLSKNFNMSISILQ